MNRILPFVAAALGFAAAPASAQFTWDGEGANGAWSTGANWVGNAAPAFGGSATTALTFAGIAQPLTVLDLGTSAAPFVLNSLTVNNDASVGFTISGGKLQFAGANPTITMNGGAGVFLRIESAVDFAAATTINSTANSTGLIYETVFAGAVTGSGAITHNGGTSREVIVTSRNNLQYSGTITQANGGVFYLGGDNAIGRQAKVVVTGGTFNSGGADSSDAASGVVGGGYSQQIGSIAASGGSLQIGGTAFQSTTLFGFDGTGTTIAAGALGANANNHLGKVGAGTTLYTGTGGYAGNLSVRDGTFAVQGTVTGTTNSGFSNSTSTGTYTAYAGAVFAETVTGGTGSAGRLGNATTIALAGGTFQFASSATTTGGFSEVVGPLVLAGGQSAIRVSAGTATGTRINFTTLTQGTPTATLLVAGNSLGLNGLGGASATNVAVNGATGPAAALFAGTTAGYAAGTTTLRILPFATASSTTAGAPETLVAYDTANQSLRGLATGDYAGAFGAAADNVSLSADASTGTMTANSLRITGSTPTLTIGSGTLNLAAGALLTTGLSIVSGPGSLAFGNASGNGTAYITNTQLLSVGAPVFAANLSKNGAGQLQFGGLVTLTATNPVIAVNAGSLQFNTGAVATGTPLSASNVLTYQVAKGATLALTNPLAIDGFKVLQGAGSVPGGNVTVSGGGVIRPSALGGSGANLASPGTLSVTALTFGPGGIYDWSLNSVQGGQYTQSLLAGAGTLAITATNANAASKFTIKITSLSLANAAGPVYDYDGGSYQWTIATYDSGITGFSADKFVLDTTGATFAGTAPNLSLATSGNSLVLIATPAVVPEPAGLLALAGLGLAAVRRIRQSRRKTILA